MNVKKPVKKLGLSRETIRELQREELGAVAGGGLTPDVRTLPLNECLVGFSMGAAVCTQGSC